MKNLTLISIFSILAAGCHSADRIELKDDMQVVLLNGKPMSEEQVDYYLENESKRKTELLITNSDGTVEHTTVGEFWDNFREEMQQPDYKESTALEDQSTINMDDPFAPPTKN